MKKISDREEADIAVLLKFVALYCRAHHDADKFPFVFKGIMTERPGKRPVLLCPECNTLMRYGLAMRLRCPHDPKPMCKKCETQCYRDDYRQKIREIMKYSGLALIKRGRLDLIYHYFR
ncbi:MAG TPA: nitrous oxide-stimulated promoter family protein [Syntrophorhabdaceae bacterium]